MSSTEVKYESGYKYVAIYKWATELWITLGVDEANDRICFARYPPKIYKFSECKLIHKIGKLTEEELKYRKLNYEGNW